MTSSSSSKNKLRIAWIIASLAALGLVLSPVSPFPLQPFSAQSLSRDPEIRADQLAEPPQPEEISEEDLLACGSLSPGVEYIISGDANEPVELDEEGEIIEENATSVLTPLEKLASDTLVGEFCNRAELIGEMSNAYDASLSLVAYGCDAASERTADVALQNSLEEYAGIYCTPVKVTIQNEIDLLVPSVQSFREDVLPLLRDELGNETLHSDSVNATGGQPLNVTSIMSEAEGSLDRSIELAGSASTALSSDSVYEAAKLLSEANIVYTGVVESEHLAFLFAEEPETEAAPETEAIE